MYLFIDTETSGLPDFRAPPDASHQPHIVSLAAWLGDFEETEPDRLTHTASLNVIIRPDSWHIDPKAETIHGISEERARAVGEPLPAVLTRLSALISDAFQSNPESLLIAHNHSFDHRMLLRDYAYARHDPVTLNLLRPFCTMRALTPRMRLPSPRGRSGEYKWPKLDEAYAFLFGRPVPGREDRHDAMADVLGCKDVYEEGHRREWW